MIHPRIALAGMAAGAFIAASLITSPQVIAQDSYLDTGSYDELTNVLDEDGTLGVFDDDGVQADDVRNSPAFVPQSVA